MYVTSVWSGGAYSVDYVHVLKKQVEAQGHQLHVHGYDTPLETHWRGWGAKIELFAPWFTYRPCLYIDLDTYILGSLDIFLDVPTKLSLIRDFNNKNRGNSGVMKIPEDTSTIWSGCQNYDGLQPDGNLLNTFPHDYLQDQYPGLIQSYKVHNLQDSKPDCPIMCFHGKPKPAQTTGWAGELWRSHLKS